MTRCRFVGTASLAVCVLGAIAQTVEDPIHDFCRRFGHQSAVIDNRLFVDGGYINYGGSLTSDPENYTNTFLTYAELTSVNGYNFPNMYNNLSKPNDVPSVIGGTLWPDTVNKLFYLYGGEYNATTAPPASPAMWFFDALYNTWNKTSNPIDSVQMASFGASAVDPVKAVGYYYGGWTSNATVFGWQGNATAQQGLVTYDMASDRFTNQTFIDSTLRAEGVMFWVPISDAGMLVYFGGIEQQANGSYTGSRMDRIHLFDIAGQKSYTQTTAGLTPPMRRRFCGGVSWPDDRSSYNIYFYGGEVPPDELGNGYNDVWILSIPSFTWTPYYNSTGFEHHSLTCNVVKEGQMIVMGGTFPNASNTACDSPSVWGMHNLDLGSSNIDQAQWYQFLPNVTSYHVPPNLTAVVGGSSTGGAHLTSPIAGFSNQDLSVYLTRQAAFNGRSATRNVSMATSAATSTPTPAPKSSDVGAIVGGVIGGVAGLIVILGIGLFCLRRRRRARGTADRSSYSAHKPEISELSTERQLVEAPGSLHSPQSNHKRGFGSAVTTPSTVGLGLNSSVQSPHEAPGDQHWQLLPARRSPHFREELPKQYYASPSHSPPQQYYPPPPAPQTSNSHPPVVEMPSSRTPMEAEYKPLRHSPQHDRTITEE